MAGALRALCGGALAAGSALRAVLARAGSRVRVDKRAQEQALKSCLASAAALRARAGSGRERPGQRTTREPEAVRRPGPDRLPCLLGFVPDGWGRDLTLEDVTGVVPRPALAGVARRHELDLGEREIGGW
jgi:hypothetical protein